MMVPPLKSHISYAQLSIPLYTRQQPDYPVLLTLCIYTLALTLKRGFYPPQQQQQQSALNRQTGFPPNRMMYPTYRGGLIFEPHITISILGFPPSVPSTERCSQSYMHDLIVIYELLHYSRYLAIIRTCTSYINNGLRTFVDKMHFPQPFLPFKIIRNKTKPTQ